MCHALNTAVKISSGIYFSLKDKNVSNMLIQHLSALLDFSNFEFMDTFHLGLFQNTFPKLTYNHKPMILFEGISLVFLLLLKDRRALFE